jgi:xanthosine utilization system XapX-like protein
MIFWLTGLAYNDGASVANYFMFMLLLFVTSLSAGLLFGILTTIVSVVTMAQASMAFVMVILVLFSGFTVQPDVIPVYVQSKRCYSEPTCCIRSDATFLLSTVTTPGCTG